MLVKFLLLFILGFAGGYLGNYTRLPGGALFGAMIFTIVSNSLFIKQRELSYLYIFCLLVFTGALIGQDITKEVLKNIWQVMLPAGMITGFMVVFGILLMFIAGNVFHWDFATAWLAIAPARMQDMVILATSLKLDGTKVISAHLARILTVLFFTTTYLSINKKDDKEWLLSKMIKKLMGKY